MRTVSAWSPPSIIDHPFWLHIWKHLSWEWWANSSILSISQTGEHRHPSKCLRGEEIDGGQPCASSCTTVVKMPRCREEDYAGGYWAIDQQLYRITFNQVLLGDLCEVQLWYLPKVETEFSLSLSFPTLIPFQTLPRVSSSQSVWQWSGKPSDLRWAVAHDNCLMFLLSERLQIMFRFNHWFSCVFHTHTYAFYI